MNVGNAEQTETGSILGRDSLHSNFDSVSLDRMSKSYARTYVSGEDHKLFTFCILLIKIARQEDSSSFCTRRHQGPKTRSRFQCSGKAVGKYF